MFLDEIGEMTPGLQSKLLRFLEEKAFKRVGGLADIRVDVRVVAATNRDLEEEVKAGKFREDLFYRLQVMPIPLPPLRERRGDIPLLANYYIDRFNREFRKRVRGLSPAAHGIARAVPVAGQRSRAAQCDRARDAARSIATTLEPADFTTLDAVRVADAVPAAARGRQPRRGRTAAADAGARTRRRQPDARRPSCSASTAIRCATASRSSA